MGHLEDLPGDPRRPAVRRDRPDLALPGLPLPTDLAETWQVNLTDELERRDRTEAGRSEPVAFTHNALHQVLERAPSNPASYTWDVHGNLKTRTGVLYGDAVFTHDWRDRLVQVQQGSTTTDIVLDPLGRMVGKVRHTPDGDLARAYLHDGDQVVLEYVQQAGGAGWQPERRHLWGRWIDDLAVEQVDNDGDGSLETTLYPITDLLGSVQLLTDEAGTPVERITYDPDGTPHFWAADTTRPSVTRIAWTGEGTLPTGEILTPQAFEIGLSEPIDPASVANATATLTPIGGEPQTLTLTLAADSRTAYLTGATLTVGTSYTLHLDGLTDTSHNPIWPEAQQLTIADPNAYEVLEDTTPPTLLAVLDSPDALYLLFDEPVEPAAGYDMTTALSLVRSGQPVGGAATRLTSNLLQWQPGGGVGGLIPGGSYTISAAHLTDLAGNAATASATFTHLNTTDQMLLLAYQAPTDTQPEAQSAYGPTTLFQGRTWHGDLGGYYYRARWYLPEMGEFGERDPVGYADSANAYLALGAQNFNELDPLGEFRIRERRVGGRIVDAYALQWGVSDAVFYSAISLLPVVGPVAGRMSNAVEGWTNVPQWNDVMTNEEALGVAGEAVGAAARYVLRGGSRVARWLRRSRGARIAVGASAPVATTVYSLYKSLSEAEKDQIIFYAFDSFMAQRHNPIGGIHIISRNELLLDLSPRDRTAMDNIDLEKQLNNTVKLLIKFNVVFRHELPYLLRAYDSVIRAEETFKGWEKIAIHADNTKAGRQRRWAEFLGIRVEDLYSRYHDLQGQKREMVDTILGTMKRLWPNLYPKLFNDLVR